VVECLPRNPEALSSDTSTKKKKERERKERKKVKGKYFRKKKKNVLGSKGGIVTQCFPCSLLVVNRQGLPAQSDGFSGKPLWGQNLLSSEFIDVPMSMSSLPNLLLFDFWRWLFCFHYKCMRSSLDYLTEPWVKRDIYGNHPYCVKLKIWKEK
jgi:hypothetical protein